MREKYSGLRGGEKGSFKPFSYFLNSESVSNFTSLGNNEKKTSFGFSFDKKTSKSETQKHYIVVSSDDDKMFNYQIYKSKETRKIFENEKDNMIIIAPNVGTVNVTLDEMQFVNGTIGFPTQDVQQNTTSTLFHEIGERNTSNINFRGGVIDYENYVRRVIGLPVRPFDLNHSKKIRTNYK